MGNIKMKAVDISPIGLRNYIIGKGWELVPEVSKGRLYLFNSPFNDFTQLMFSEDRLHRHYDEMINIVIEKLADVYRRTECQILEDIKMLEAF